MEHLLSSLALALLMLTPADRQQDAAAPVTEAAPAPEVRLLWPEGTPGVPVPTPEEIVTDRAGGGDRHVKRVHAPSITVYRPAAAAATPAPAVVVCPGGGYGVLALDKEGHDIARWLAEQGVVGVVLKYRLPRPEGHVYGHEAPLVDAARALVLVREGAAEWGVDPARVGIMGFSAGGHLAASASVQLTEGGPDFTALIYPVVSFLPGIGHDGSRNNLLGPEAPEELVQRFSSELQVSKDTPPAFLVHTADDWVRPVNSLRYASALQEAGVRAELHLFHEGGHGYGMRRPDLPVGQWPGLLTAWMRSAGFLGAR